MNERNEIVERYRRLREDPMTPQYLTAPGQSGSLLDYREADELGRTSCRHGHQRLVGPFRDDQHRFCARCGARVCVICGADVGNLWNSWLDHKKTHQ